MWDSGRKMSYEFARTQTCGYTLIELLLVVAILGLSGVLLVPNLIGRDVMNAEAAVRQLIGDLSFAQSDALAHQEIRRVHFYDDGRGYCIVRLLDASEIPNAFDPATADYIHDPLMRSQSQGDYIVDFTADERFEGITITKVEIDGTDREVHYDSLGGTIMSGGIPGTGGVIELTREDETYEITIAPFTGKLTVNKL